MFFSRVILAQIGHLGAAKDLYEDALRLEDDVSVSFRLAEALDRARGVPDGSCLASLVAEDVVSQLPEKTRSDDAEGDAAAASTAQTTQEDKADRSLNLHVAYLW